jgi:hypothetical protein
VRQIADVLRRANGHRGTKRLALLIADGPAPTCSGHEDVVLDLILDAGLEHPDVNERLVVGGTSYYPDMRWAAQPARPRGRQPVARRPPCAGRRRFPPSRPEAFGERVLRTTLEQAMLSPRQLIARLTAAGAPYTDRQR